MARPQIAPASALQPVQIRVQAIETWARIEVGKRMMADQPFATAVEAEVSRRVREYLSMGCVVID